MRQNISQLWGAAFAKRHAKLFEIAATNKLALCGSTAYAMVKGNSNYTPKDLDFVGANDGSVENAISDICAFLAGQKCHWRIYCNANNAYCGGISNLHVRITTPFWLPVCIFGIPHDKFKRHCWKGNVWIQDINTIKNQAESFEQLDGKARLAAEKSALNSIHEPIIEQEPQAITTEGQAIEKENSLDDPFDWVAKEMPPYQKGLKQEG